MTTLNTTPQNHEQLNKQPCLFAVHGNSRETRRKRIEAVAELEPSIAFLAAVFDFEWMVRRAILALSACPTPFIRKYFEKKHGLVAYKEAWSLFVSRHCSSVDESFEGAIKGKQVNGTEILKALSDAFAMRHPIVHGANGFIKDSVADFNRGVLLDASDFLEMFLNKRGKTAFDEIRRLRCPKSGLNGRGLRKDSLNGRAKLEARVSKRIKQGNMLDS